MRTAPLLACAALAALSAAPAAPVAAETLSFGRFGEVALYHEAPRPQRVAIFVSGDGGWNLGVVDMARELAGLDALVVGVDIRRYLKALEASAARCSYPAADFEALSKFVQAKLGYASYVAPVLVGYSSGATLVYAALVQAPAGTFAGAVSLGFCPDLEVRKPFCRGSGLAWRELPKGRGFDFLPAPELETPWVALQGTIDQVCDAAATEAFVRQVGRGRVVLLPKVGHGFSVPRNWMPQFREAFAGITARSADAAQRPPAGAAPSPAPAPAPAAPSLAGLPLVEVPPRGAPNGVLAVLVSGDGGWAGIDRQLAAALAADGVTVVGLDSLQYFWSAKDPDRAGAALERVLRHYLAPGRLERVLLAGYSFGADVLPFMAARLPAELRDRVALVALLGPGRTAQFEFHILEWVSAAPARAALPLLPEVARLEGTRLLCLMGDDEKDSLCPTLPPGRATVVALPGGHHFGGDYRRIAALILDALAAARGAAR